MTDEYQIFPDYEDEQDDIEMEKALAKEDKQKKVFEILDKVKDMPETERNDALDAMLEDNKPKAQETPKSAQEVFMEKLRNAKTIDEKAELLASQGLYKDLRHGRQDPMTRNASGNKPVMLSELKPIKLDRHYSQVKEKELKEKGLLEKNKAQRQKNKVNMSSGADIYDVKEYEK